jgi:four helix bundle protein
MDTMSALRPARDFRDLIAYQKAKAVAKCIFQVTQRFPKEEMYSLTDQIRRASPSVDAQITEGWAERRHERRFVSQLTDADGEQQETQHWIDATADCGYVTQDQAEPLTSEWSEVGRRLNSMIQKADSFCGDPPRTHRSLITDH